MSDYGLLAAVRDVLLNCEALKNAGINRRIYFKLPPKPMYPCLLLEVGDVWQDYTAGDNQAMARINFHINLLSQSHMGTTPTIISCALETCIDAHSLRLSPTYIANFRKTGHVIELPMLHTPRTFKQFYQAIIWRKAEAEEAI